ncbi:dialkylrecorsinol condensing enzyme [Natronospira bacteriovora]|uniref:Dialkylresorcinol condensing enzyme n=1 Tax=Natronospira bacteriovora TaxID=3069753 RepID=A0ABU0W7N2_9GAMM|nr:dialkylrecorsinol condensing enzyme [Natronospira sp. AB-CW4]MDQ2070006.1 dialkylresorcinol condensing enzyme [Natronospira sp. AB-CW4]
MSKRVLTVYWSQSGQTERVARSMVAPLEAADGVEVVHARLRPRMDYPFPWTVTRFLDVFPESVHLDPPPMDELDLPHEDFDLVILVYQVWFLSPCPPVTGFLKSDQGRRLLRDTPVVTVTACRNMWLTAQEKVKGLLAEAGARLTDHVAVVDPGPPLATFITTPRWLLSGDQGRADGWLPPAGLREHQIRGMARFGHALVDGLARDVERAGQSMLTGLLAAPVDRRFIISERIGHRSFYLWGKLLRAVGRQGQRRRRPVLYLYMVFLVAMIITVVPVSLLLQRIARPLLARRLEERQRYFEAPSGAGRERMEAFHGE